MVRGNTVTPNQDSDGKVIAQSPARSVGGWRGREGFRRFAQVVNNTRFRIREDANSEILWTAWNITQGGGDRSSRHPPPLVCTVCGAHPQRSSIMNMVSAGKSSAECSCSWRPVHGTVEGRVALAAIVARTNNELLDSESEWVALHMHRSERWRTVGLRCLDCKRERHVISGGVLKTGKFTGCICVRKSETKAKVRARAKARAEAESVALEADQGLAPSDSDE